MFTDVKISADNADIMESRRLLISRQYAMLHNECMVFYNGKAIARFNGPAFEVYQSKMKQLEKRLNNFEYEIEKHEQMMNSTQFGTYQRRQN